MEVEILDNKYFNTLNPANVEKYLERRHWQRKQVLPNEVSIWDFNDENGTRKHRVWLPMAYDLADFAESMGRLVKVVAQVEDRSQLQILEDLSTSAIGDVIRVSAYDEFDRVSSSLPLDEGIYLHKQAKDMANAAAKSVIQAREVHPLKGSRQVTQYLKNLRLGQTEHGSYTIKLISPITGEINNQLSLTNIPTPSPMPFERQAVEQLVKGLTALSDAVQDIKKRKKFILEPFQEAVPMGVSANLCEAIIARERDAQYRPIEVSVTWSYALPITENLSVKPITFEPDAMGYIAQAAYQFRLRNPITTQLYGYIKILDRERGEDRGTVTMISIIEERQRHVRIELSGEAYRQAMRAHENDSFALCEGGLVKEGKFYYLKNPINFQLVTKSDDVEDDLPF